MRIAPHKCLFPEVLSGQRTMPLIDLSTGKSGIENRGVGILTEFEITDDILNHLKAVGVLDATTEKQLAQLTEFERMLVSGLHWFGKSEVQPNRTDRFLNLTTVLEIVQLFLATFLSERCSRSHMSSLLVVEAHDNTRCLCPR